MDQSKEAFEDSYKVAHESLAKYCHAICGAKEDAKDLINEVALRAFESFDRIKNKGSFTYFVIAMARRIYLNNQRRKKFWGVWSFNDAEKLVQDEYGVEAQIEVKELYGALSKLPMKQREAIILSEITGYKIREIAELQKLGISAVKSNIRRGKIKLRQFLTEKPYNEKRLFQVSKQKL